MRFSLPSVLSICAIALTLVACGSSQPTITEPVGAVQLGMTVDQVADILGSGRVVEPAKTGGLHTMEVREYPADNGRVYLVRFIDGLVRRWEIQAR